MVAVRRKNKMSMIKCDDAELVIYTDYTAARG